LPAHRKTHLNRINVKRLSPEQIKKQTYRFSNNLNTIIFRGGRSARSRCVILSSLQYSFIRRRRRKQIIMFLVRRRRKQIIMFLVRVHGTSRTDFH